MDATDVIEAFGGYSALAQLLGINRTTVFMWQSTYGIPETRCLEIWRLTERLRKEGTAKDRRRLKSITLEVLLQAKVRPSALPTTVRRRPRAA